MLVDRMAWCSTSRPNERSIDCCRSRDALLGKRMRQLRFRGTQSISLDPSCCAIYDRIPRMYGMMAVHYRMNTQILGYCVSGHRSPPRTRPTEDIILRLRRKNVLFWFRTLWTGNPTSLNTLHSKWFIFDVCFFQTGITITTNTFSPRKFVDRNKFVFFYSIFTLNWLLVGLPLIFQCYCWIWAMKLNWLFGQAKIPFIPRLDVNEMERICRTCCSILLIK